MMRIAILDDYQAAALTLADWRSLHPEAQIEAFDKHIADEDELARRLHVFEAIVAMRCAHLGIYPADDTEPAHF